MRNVDIPHFLELKARSKQYYPTSQSMRVQWLRQTVHLYKSGRHVLLTGKFAGGRHEPIYKNVSTFFCNTY